MATHVSIIGEKHFNFCDSLLGCNAHCTHLICFKFLWACISSFFGLGGCSPLSFFASSISASPGPARNIVAETEKLRSEQQTFLSSLFVRLFLLLFNFSSWTCSVHVRNCLRRLTGDKFYVTNLSSELHRVRDTAIMRTEVSPRMSSSRLEAQQQKQRRKIDCTQEGLGIFFLNICNLQVNFNFRKNELWMIFFLIQINWC